MKELLKEFAAVILDWAKENYDVLIILAVGGIVLYTVLK